MDEEKLTGIDYVTRPLGALMRHPDYNERAFAVIASMCKMTNEQLVRVNTSIAELRKGT